MSFVFDQVIIVAVDGGGGSSVVPVKSVPSNTITHSNILSEMYSYFPNQTRLLLRSSDRTQTKRSLIGLARNFLNGVSKYILLLLRF